MFDSCCKYTFVFYRCIPSVSIFYFTSQYHQFHLSQAAAAAATTATTPTIALKFHSKHEKRKQNREQNEQIAIKKLNEHENT
jgi:hypothetical protein